MVLAEFGSGQALLTVFWFFMFVIWFWLLLSVFGDIFRDRELSGWAKAAWTAFVIVAPYLGVFIYLIARGRGMTDRTLAAEQRSQARFDDYVRETAGGTGAADQIAKGKQLLDQGAISQEEFEALKREALTGTGHQLTV
jgi:hypothetical protein